MKQTCINFKVFAVAPTRDVGELRTAPGSPARSHLKKKTVFEVADAKGSEKGMEGWGAATPLIRHR